MSAYNTSFNFISAVVAKRSAKRPFAGTFKLGNPSGSGTKKGYKRVQSKNISDKGAKRTKSTKGSIISSIFSAELTKLKCLIKFNNQLEIPLDQSL